MNTSIIAAVVTFNPGAEVIDNILTYYDFVEKVIIVDNSEKDALPFFDQLHLFSKIILIRNRENTGLGKALNIAATTAIELNYNWLLTMDQDSKFEAAQWKNYINCFEQIKNDTTGIIGINFSGRKNEITNCTKEIADTLITSGSIMNLKAWKKIEGFNEALFIDGVDDEYCFRLKGYQYAVIKLNNISLNHNLGNDILVKNWHIGPLVKRNIHAPIRLYYMVRNYLFLIHKYKHDFPEKTSEYKKTLSNKIKNNLLYNKGRIKLINYLLKGVYHFYIKKQGKLDE